MPRNSPRPSLAGRYKGAGNPNYRGGPLKLNCEWCNRRFETRNKKNPKYCSRHCLAKCRRLFAFSIKYKKPKPLRIIRVKNKRKPKPILECLYCKKEFRASPSQKRIYCSYKCHIAAGGAYRAGMASLQARINMRYGAKKDANHKEIVDALREAGAFVKDISNIGCGAPDLIVWSGSNWEMVEIKNPKTSYGKKGFNKNQLKWQDEWTGIKVHLVRSVDEALAWWHSIHIENKPPEIHSVSSAKEAIDIIEGRA